MVRQTRTEPHRTTPCTVKCSENIELSLNNKLFSIASSIYTYAINPNDGVSSLSHLKTEQVYFID